MIPSLTRTVARRVDIVGNSIPVLNIRRNTYRTVKEMQREIGLVDDIEIRMRPEQMLHGSSSDYRKQEVFGQSAAGSATAATTLLFQHCNRTVSVEYNILRTLFKC